MKLGVERNKVRKIQHPEINPIARGLEAEIFFVDDKTYMQLIPKVNWIIDLDVLQSKWEIKIAAQDR